MDSFVLFLQWNTCLDSLLLGWLGSYFGRTWDNHLVPWQGRLICHAFKINASIRSLQWEWTQLRVNSVRPSWVKPLPKASQNPFLKDNNVQITVSKGKKCNFLLLGVGIFAYLFFFLIMGFITFHQFADLSPVEMCLFVSGPIYCVWDLSWVCWPLAKLCKDWVSSFLLSLAWRIAFSEGSPHHGGCPCSGRFLFTSGLVAFVSGWVLFFQDPWAPPLIVLPGLCVGYHRSFVPRAIYFESLTIYQMT